MFHPCVPLIVNRNDSKKNKCRLPVASSWSIVCSMVSRSGKFALPSDHAALPHFLQEALSQQAIQLPGLRSCSTTTAVTLRPLDHSPYGHFRHLNLVPIRTFKSSDAKAGHATTNRLRLQIFTKTGASRRGKNETVQKTGILFWFKKIVAQTRSTAESYIIWQTICSAVTKLLSSSVHSDDLLTDYDVKLATIIGQ